MEILQRSPLKRYGIAVLASLTALTLTLVFGNAVDKSVFAFFFVAVVATAYYSGFAPSLLVIGMAVAFAGYFIIFPAGTFLNHPPAPLQLGIFTTMAFGISLLSSLRERNAVKLRESERFLATTLRSIGDAVIATDGTGRVSFMNPVAETLTGWTEREAAGRPLADIFIIVNEDTRAPVESPVEKVIQEGRIVGLANHTVLIAKDGREIPIEDSAAPIKDREGRLLGVIMVFHDVTERRRLEIEQNYLFQSSELLASSLDYEMTLKRLADLSVPHIADWCAVDIINDDGIVERLAVAHVDPEKVKWAHELEEKYPADPNAPTGVYQVIRTGKSEFYPFIPEEMLMAGAVNDEHREIIHQIGFTSAIVVPLMTRDRTFGAVTLVTTLSGSNRRYTDRDLALAQDIARHAGMAIENARLYRNVRRDAEEIGRQAARFSSLAEIGEDLTAARLDYRAVLDTITRRLADVIGDGCVLRLIEGDMLPAAAFHHRDPAGLEALHAFIEGTPHGRYHGLPGEVARTGEGKILHAVDEPELIAGLPKDEYVERFGLQSLAIAPLKIRGEVIGTISLTRDWGGAEYTPSDQLLLQGLADRAALAIENAQLFRNAEEQREWFEVTLSSIGDAVIATDTEGHITFMNPVAERLTRWSEEEAMAKPLDTVFNIVNEDTRQIVESPVAKVLRDGMVVGLANHTVLIGKDGHEVPIDDSAAPIRAVEGEMRGVVLVFHDISERKVIEDERARLFSEVASGRERLNSLIASIPGVVWEAWGEPDQGSQKIDFVSDYVEQMLGYTKEEWLATPNFWLTIVHPDDRERAAREALAKYESGEVGDNQFRWMTRDGQVLWVVARSIAVLDGDGKPIGMRGVTMDISERKRAENALIEGERRFRTLADSAPVLIWMAGPDGVYNYFNRTWLEFTGKTEQQELEEGWTSGIHRDDVEQCIGIFQAAFAGHRMFRMEYRFRRADGEYRWVLDTGTPRLSSSGEFLGYIGSCVDITDLKMVESELMGAKEIAEAANAAKDHFLAVLSHELRTPLTPVLAIAESLEAESVPEDLRPMIEVIRRNVELEVHLIDDLLDLVRVARGKIALESRPVDLHKSVMNALEICRGEIDEKGLHVTMDLTARQAGASGDPARLQQVFWNLIKNSVKFTQAGGNLTIRSSNPSPGRVAIAVIDNGIGIETEHLPRIFNAFEQGEQTITRRFGGLGLGLSISKALIDLHDGTITASSDGTNHGAAFVVELPLAVEVPIIERPSVVAGEQKGEKKRILIVDDHKDTNMVMRLLLERRGYDVLAAGTMNEALEIASNNQFDLLVSDIGLPDGSGLELIRLLRERGPVKAVALSGFGMEGDVQKSLEAGFSEHLTKPVTFQKLQEIIDRLL
ncbi:MAG: domain S-box [Chlorobi bacterium]|nr:domain S-box [Chlorobiota bacterium]